MEECPKEGEPGGPLAVEEITKEGESVGPPLRRRNLLQQRANELFERCKRLAKVIRR